ncbi:hypothetical protein OG625_21540 [Streptomyces sp. NBC_01351]|uniref:hypothetical protein n=1 Tax=Streptomyces sp. NBC_01351 TaxID=2903833 RepID=UPI002E3098AB|nr:hypothetical protein [Streptomyces sp. NBC_01351]
MADDAEQVWEPLSEDVRRTLELILSEDTPVVRAYRAQIPHTMMTGSCTCGCPSTYLRVDQDAVPAASPGQGPIVAAESLWSAEGDWVGEALVFANGYLHDLEVCHMPDLGPLDLPLWQRIADV